MNISGKKIRVLSTYTVVACLLSVALIGAPVSAYNGIQLNSGTVGNFSLVDQNNSEYKLSDATEEIVIVSFFFTRCPDVCPVITQNLKLVHDTCTSSLFILKHLIISLSDRTVIIDLSGLLRWQQDHLQ